MRQVIILIRHGEKPGDGPPGKGIDEDGTEDDESLIVRGWQRAGGLALLFGGGSSGFERPDRIYASGVVKKDGTGSRSKRPLQTVRPLAQRLNLKPIDDFSKGQEPDLAVQLVALAGVTLVSWQHESIPKIVRAFAGDRLHLDWPDERYDLVWRLTRSTDAPNWSFSESAQGLLAGDVGLTT